MANTYSAGIATAYGAAVRGGYTGTYDDFCRQQAEYAESAAAVEQAKEDAEAAASAADTSKTAAAGSASAAATSAGQASTSATNAANSATEANASKNAAATSATEAGNFATAAAGSAATAQGVLESIPPSYDDLADEVADLKEDYSNSIRSTIGTVKITHTEVTDSAGNHYYKLPSTIYKGTYLTVKNIANSGSYSFTLVSSDGAEQNIPNFGHGESQAFIAAGDIVQIRSYTGSGINWDFEISYSTNVEGQIDRNYTLIQDGIQNVRYLCMWEIGGLSNGIPIAANYRIRSGSFIQFEKDTRIEVQSGRRLGIHYFTDDGTFESDTGWITGTYIIPKDKKLKMLISATPTTSAEEYAIQADVDTFTTYVTVYGYLQYFVDNKLTKFATSSGYPMKPSTSVTELLQTDNTKHLQGAVVHDDILYYSMYNDSAAYIYKYDLTNEELITSSSGSYGHAGDLAYNTKTNELITINPLTSASDLFFLDGDTLALKRTMRIATPGWRIAGMAYLEDEDKYVMQYAKNGVWNDFKFVISDTDFIPLVEFEPIYKNIYMTLQGIDSDGKFIYASYAYPNRIFVYDVSGNYRGYHTIPFNTELECVTKLNDTTLIVGEDGNQKLYKLALSYDWS